MIIKDDLKKNTDFEKFYNKYESVISTYAMQLSNEIGRPDEFDDYKQAGAIALFDLFKNPENFQISSIAFKKKVLKNSIRYYRRRSYNYDKKIILRNDIDQKPNIALEPNNIRFKVYKALNLYNFNILKISEDDIIHSIDIINILKRIKNYNVKISFVYWSNYYSGSEISKMLGISKQAVYKIIKKIRKILSLYYYEVI